MSKFISSLLLALVLVALNSAGAFTIQQAGPALTTRGARSTTIPSISTTFSPFENVPATSSSSTTTTTALQLKIKVDPEKAKMKNAAGVAKGAAYGGSILIAVLLPVAFLIWAAIK